MSETELDKLLSAARNVKVTDEAREQQRRNFVYGNTHAENDRITRQTVDRAAERLSKESGAGPAN